MKSSKVRNENAHMSKIMLNLNLLSIFTGDYTLKLHGREISRLSDTSQRRTSNYLSYLEKEKILVSEIKGRTKDYSLNLNNESVKHLLVMAEEFRAITFLESAYEIKDFFASVSDLVTGYIVVFGSYAKNQADKQSDLDILIIGNYNKEKFRKIAKRYPFKLHIINITKTEFIRGMKKRDNFIIEILMHHIIIKGHNMIVNRFWRLYNGRY